MPVSSHWAGKLYVLQPSFERIWFCFNESIDAVPITDVCRILFASNERQCPLISAAPIDRIVREIVPVCLPILHPALRLTGQRPFATWLKAVVVSKRSQRLPAAPRERGWMAGACDTHLAVQLSGFSSQTSWMQLLDQSRRECARFPSFVLFLLNKNVISWSGGQIWRYKWADIRSDGVISVAQWENWWSVKIHWTQDKNIYRSAEYRKTSTVPDGMRAIG